MNMLMIAAAALLQAGTPMDKPQAATPPFTCVLAPDGVYTGTLETFGNPSSSGSRFYLLTGDRFIFRFLLSKGAQDMDPRLAETIREKETVQVSWLASRELGTDANRPFMELGGAFLFVEHGDSANCIPTSDVQVARLPKSGS